MGTYPEASARDLHLTIDVTLEELEAYVASIDPQIHQYKDGPLKSFMELMFDCLCNHKILDERNFRLGEEQDGRSQRRPEGPVILEQYFQDEA